MPPRILGLPGLPGSIAVKPMLAQQWRFSRFMPGTFIQPKMDGLRALYQNGQLVSREGFIWQADVLAHITELLKKIVPEKMILDGELYCHGLPLQWINSRASVRRTKPHSEATQIQYHVFDCVSYQPFGARFGQLLRLGLQANKSIVNLTPTYQVFTHEQSDELYERFLAEGYEGAMYRIPNHPYATFENTRNKENRCDWLLKRKEWADIDGVILMLNEGEGENLGQLGSFTVSIQHEGQPTQCFNVGSGLSQAQRKLYWEEPWRVHKRKIKIKFRTLSATGIPLEPRIIHIDETYIPPA